MSQAPEDRATTKRCRVLPQIVISRRGRLVTRSIWSEPRKINYVNAENAPESRLVTPNTWASLVTHVVTSLGSHGARVGG